MVYKIALYNCYIQSVDIKHYDSIILQALFQSLDKFTKTPQLVCLHTVWQVVLLTYSSVEFIPCFIKKLSSTKIYIKIKMGSFSVLILYLAL